MRSILYCGHGGVLCTPGRRSCAPVPVASAMPNYSYAFRPRPGHKRCMIEAAVAQYRHQRQYRYLAVGTCKLTSAKELPMPPLLQGGGRTRVIRNVRCQIGSRLPAAAPTAEMSRGRSGCPNRPLSRDVNVLDGDCARGEELAGDGGGLALSRLGGPLSPGRDALLEEAVVGTPRISGLRGGPDFPTCFTFFAFIQHARARESRSSWFAVKL